jgi:uncharacterized 2Fe-2S/4Fe-4S cluster protein (DUF4445 family)
MAKVTFVPSGISCEVEAGTTIMEAAVRVGVTIQTTCGGKASCRLCKVRIVDGVNAISPMEFAELNALGNVFFITRERLSCQTRLLGEVTVEVPEAQAPIVKKPYRPMRYAR